MRFGMISGNGSRVLWQTARKTNAVPSRTIGGYRSVKRRYYRWNEMGVLDEMLSALAREAGLEWLMIDSTIVRTHQHAAGARKVKGADA